MNTRLSKCALIFLCLPSSLLAAWSGVSLTIGDETIPALIENKQITLTPFTLNLQIEDKTSQGLRIGANIAKVSVELQGDALNLDAPGDAIGLYLYLPYQFNATFGLVSRFSFLYVGTTSADDEGVTLDYLTKSLSLGITLRLYNIRVLPSINARIIDGDYKDLTNNQSFRFKQKQTTYTRVQIDYFIEQYSFVRLTLNEHSEHTFMLSFSTIY